MHQKQKMYLLIGGFMALAIFFFVFGLNLLIGLGIWVGSLFGNDQEVKAQQEEFFGTLYVDNLPLATNSASLIVSGSTSNFDVVRILVNDAEAAEVKVLDADSFTKEVTGLKAGDNTVQVIAETENGKNTKESEAIKVLYKNTKPKLEIAEPAEGAKTTEREITIKGKTDEDNSVFINGSPATVTAGGAFEDEVRLVEGENKITIEAEDIAGNTETKTVTVLVEKEG